MAMAWTSLSSLALCCSFSARLPLQCASRQPASCAASKLRRATLGKASFESDYAVATSHLGVIEKNTERNVVVKETEDFVFVTPEILPRDPISSIKLESDLLKKKIKREELRRKRLVRKRQLRKKGRWPPSKLAKTKNV